MAANPRDLITLARAYQNLQGISSIDTLLQTLLTAASDAVQKYCKRDFVSTAYDELYSGSGDRRLLLRQYPMISVQSVRYRPVTVLKITNTLPAIVQARVSVASTGLTLVRVNAGVKATDTSITFGGNSGNCGSPSAPHRRLLRRRPGQPRRSQLNPSPPLAGLCNAIEVCKKTGAFNQSASRPR